jgi:uncharacterized protein with NRDE domain
MHLIVSSERCRPQGRSRGKSVRSSTRARLHPALSVATHPWLRGVAVRAPTYDGFHVLSGEHRDALHSRREGLTCTKQGDSV